MTASRSIRNACAALCALLAGLAFSPLLAIPNPPTPDTNWTGRDPAPSKAPVRRSIATIARPAMTPASTARRSA